MSRWIVLLIIFLVVAGVLTLLYFLGRRAQKKQDEQELRMEEAAQKISLLVIDKKKMRLKDAGFPQVVMDNANFLAKRAKVPVVKAKIGPQIVTLIADEKIFDSIPVKKEVKAVVSGMYIVSVKAAHGKTEHVPQKKKNAFKRMVEKLQEKTGATPIKK